MHNYTQTFEEWKQTFLTHYSRSNYTDSNVKVFHSNTDESYPDKLDWRNENAVTSVKNQVCIFTENITSVIIYTVHTLLHILTYV